jgi:hypothetical protein
MNTIIEDLLRHNTEQWQSELLNKYFQSLID